LQFLEHDAPGFLLGSEALVQSDTLTSPCMGTRRRERSPRLFNPKSEIQTGKMAQEVGAETNRKNRGIPKAVCRDFFNSFMPKRLWQIAGFNFGFRV